MIQKIITSIKKLLEKPTDEPKLWNCGHVCRPSELHIHFKLFHMQVKS